MPASRKRTRTRTRSKGLRRIGIEDSGEEVVSGGGGYRAKTNCDKAAIHLMMSLLLLSRSRLHSLLTVLVVVVPVVLVILAGVSPSPPAIVLYYLNLILFHEN